jgi:hypothetical protein
VSVGLLLIRRLRPIGEPDTFRSLGSSGAGTMDGTAGAGRIVHALAEAGIGIDSMTQLVIPAEVDPQALPSLDLRGRYATVVLGSHLVNLPDEQRRAAFLRVAVRHLTEEGTLIVEHHPIDWAETAEPVEPTPGSTVGMEEVRRDPPFVSAVSVYDVGGRMARQPFTARVLSEAELADAVAGVGLRVWRIAPTWIEARPRA